MNTLKAWLVVIGISLGTGAARAADYEFSADFGWLSKGESFEIQKGHVFWLGQFSGTSLSKDAPDGFETIAWQCPGSFDIDFTTNQVSAWGYCTATIATGDSFFLKWSCSAALDGAAGTGLFPFGKANACSGTGVIIGGTGKLATLQGGNVLHGTTIKFHPDGTGSGYTTNEWRITLE